MNVYIDADAIVASEKGDFDLVAWLEERPDDIAILPPTVWQQLLFGAFARDPARSQKRLRTLSTFGFSVSSFSRRHASRAAQIAADLKREGIGFADCQIAASALEDDAELLSFNARHFRRVPGLRLATI